MEFILWLLVVIAAGAIGYRAVRWITIYEYQRGLKYSRGIFSETLEPGQHWYVPLFTTIRTIEVRPRIVTIPGQEVLSADGVSLKVSLAANFEVVNPNVAVNDVQDYEGTLYLHLQLALREIIGGQSADALLENRGEIGGRLQAMTEAKIQEIGLRLITVDLKDIMFPGQLKQLFAQVVAAQKEGQAALERARGESAALRSLANAAKLLENNPALMQLRLIQAVGESSGNSITLEMPGESTAPKDVSKSKSKAKKASKKS